MWATITGVFTSVVAAVASDLDIDSFHVESPRSWIKVLLIIFPAITGALTEFKPKKGKANEGQ